MSGCHLTAGCSPQTQYGSVTRTQREGKAGSNSPYGNCWHHKPTAAPSGQPQHTAEAVTGSWEAAQLCLWKDSADSHDRGGGAHTAVLLTFGIPNDIGG